MVKVYLYRTNKIVSVFEEEAETLLKKELACLPENKPNFAETEIKTEVKAEKAQYENKAIKPKKRGRN